MIVFGIIIGIATIFEKDSRYRGCDHLIKAYIVDDETLALKNMTKLLNGFTEINILATFQNPSEAIEAFKQERADVVFLDIEMPVIDGLQAAEYFQQVDPHVMIVFTTAYNVYAVDAFELHALDYLLKPIRKERLEKTIHRVRMSKASTHSPLTQQTVIRMFGTLEYEQSGKTELFQWRTSKVQELFAYLLHMRYRKVRRDVLIDILWPDSEPGKAYTNLYTAVYQLRRTLAQMELGIHISSGEEGYYLDMEQDSICIDVQEWEQFMTTDLLINETTLSQHREMIALNRGEYLGEYDYVWAENSRQQLGMQWLYHAVKMSDYLMGIQSYPEAITLCDDMQKRFPYSGHSYFNLMKIFDALGDRSKVEAQYIALSNLLAEELNEEPEPYITQWYESWKS